MAGKATQVTEPVTHPLTLAKGSQAVTEGYGAHGAGLAILKLTPEQSHPLKNILASGVSLGGPAWDEGSPYSSPGGGILRGFSNLPQEHIYLFSL